MHSLRSTVREALRCGRQPQDVVDVLLEHGVSTEKILEVWPDTVDCPLYESSETPTQSDIDEGLAAKPSFDDVPRIETPSFEKEDTSVLGRVRNLLGIRG